MIRPSVSQRFLWLVCVEGPFHHPQMQAENGGRRTEVPLTKSTMMRTHFSRMLSGMAGDRYK